jgi:hypothetical protein
MLLENKMPYAIRKNPDGSFRVFNKKTGEIMAKHTTKEKAQKQVRFLEMIMKMKKEKQ